MDLDTVKTELVSREFLAVVLAGFGKELQPLTSDYGDEPSPKALLPVANRPMIEYVLSWIEESGIKDVLIICPTIHRPAIYHHIHSDLFSSNLNIDIQTYDETNDSSIGTCTLLRHFAHRIQEDFVLLPCDCLPPPSLPLSSLLNKFRADSGTNESIVTTCWYSSGKLDKASSPEEWGIVSPPTPIVWDDASGALLHVETADDVDQNSQEIELRMSLLSKYPRVRLSSNFRDSHAYVCRHSVLDALREKVHLDSFREDFIPWLCKLQYQRLKREKYGYLLYPGNHVQSSPSVALQHSTLLEYGTESGNVLSLDSSAEEVFASLKVGVVLHQLNMGCAIRAHDMHSYVEVNRRALFAINYTLPTDPENRALIDPKAQISMDTIVGESTKVSERATIKKSVIGRHCIIGKMAKIVGCILLDHCVVEDGAKIDGSILGKNTKIGIKAELSRCITQAGYEVNAGDIAKNEKLESTDWTAAPDIMENDEDEERGKGVDA